MTNVQWAERITALAKDRVKTRLEEFEKTMRDAIRSATHYTYWDAANEIATLEWLVAEVQKRNPTVAVDGPVRVAKWLNGMQDSEESKIREEMMAKLDIFGQLREAKGEDWTLKEMPNATGNPE